MVEAKPDTTTDLILHLRIWQQLPSKGVVEQLALLADGPLDVEAQWLLLKALGSPICQVLPPNVQYVQRLVKALIQAAEADGCQLGEQLLQLQTALLYSASSAAALAQADSSWRFKTFYYSSSPSWPQLTQLQQQQQKAVARASRSSSSVAPSQLQDLWQRQQLMAELAAAAGCGVLQQQDDPLTPAAPGPAHIPCRCSSDAASTGLPSPQDQQLASDPSACCNAGGDTSDSSGSGCAGLLSLFMSDNLFEGGTGCHMWDAGFLLAEYVLSHPEVFRGRRCLEVGCGPGLVASCLCRVMGTVPGGQLLLTDGDPQTLDNCISNLSLNGHSDAVLLGSWQEAVLKQQEQPTAVLACPLVWDDDVPGLAADVIVGSDCCYDPAAVPSLVRLLQQLLHAPGSPVAYLATTRRQPATLRLLEEQAAAAGLVLQQVALGPGWAVRFQQLPALDERQQRFVLHKVHSADWRELGGGSTPAAI